MTYCNHHPVFGKYKCLSGKVKDGYSNDFLGVVTKKKYYPLTIPSMNDYPPFNEEYFEWIDLLESVANANKTFTMVELGAGWGRWLARAVGALRQYNNIPYYLIGVEAEPTHVRWMKEHFIENDINLSNCKIVQSAVGKYDGYCKFLTNIPPSCYGQHIIIKGSLDGGSVLTPNLSVPTKSNKDVVISGLKALSHINIMPILKYIYYIKLQNIRQGKKIKSVSLYTIIKDIKSVDLIDSDIQGSEYDVFSALPKEEYNKIKRIHIGTHSIEVENKLRELFNDIGWRNNYDFSIQNTIDTEYGRIHFIDGVQSWSNPICKQ